MKDRAWVKAKTEDTSRQGEEKGEAQRISVKSTGTEDETKRDWEGKKQ